MLVQKNQCEEIIAENLQDVVKNINLQIQKGEQIPVNIDSEKTMPVPSHIIIKHC